MDKKDPYLLLIENGLGKLTLKYSTDFRYEISKTNFSYSFTIFQDNTPILHKEVPVVDDPEQISLVHYQILRDFFIGGIERILMQKENEKRLFPKKHSDVKDNPIQLTKGTW